VLANGDLRYTSAIDVSAPAVVGRWEVRDADGIHMPLRVDEIACEPAGPVRACVRLRATVGDDRRRLDLVARYSFFAEQPFVRVQATLRNPRRAQHAGGFWDLGDPGSLLIRELAFVVTLPEGQGTRDAWCSPEPSLALERCALPYELYQASSGGEHWRSSNHLDRHRSIPLEFRGYRTRSGSIAASGLRATPVVTVRHGAHVVSLAQRQFWQRFPKAIETDGTSVRLGLLPALAPGPHELQGGEQVTEEFVVSFAEDTVTETTLDWVRDPLRVTATPEWYCGAGAMPALIPAARDPNAGYLALVNAAIVGDEALAIKRERIDEYGWRSFGDLYADHETVKHQGPSPLISHYNNQYDAVAGFACQFFRTGNLGWLALMEDLARHVIDIDIYHTSEDKPAYSQGLFWHTAHHTDADLATHRTYPRSAAPSSGGPSPEHNYNTGLMLHYFLTGDVHAREAAIGLADWVIAMDDGRRTPLRWLTRQPTGIASATGSVSYHGPGRAPGNSIVSLINACRLTGEQRYLQKAEALIGRCVHPRDDLPSLDLLDAERRWYYTVFMQALGRYLEFKAERGALDARYAYARAALLHYARWMAVHEYPYLEKPAILEYPTETWAAQDMRKSEVFHYAARHAAGEERSVFLERADFFFDYSVSTLLGVKTRTFTRPIVLMLTNGYAHAYYQLMGVSSAPEPGGGDDFGTPVRFRPQKAVALQRLVILCGLAAAAGIAALAALL
jgi:hypothetical protein